MKQMSFSQIEFERKKRLPKCAAFLSELEQLIPWFELPAVVLPYYRKGAGARPPVGLERMLRVYCAQVCYKLLNECVEDAITDSQALRAFVGIGLSREAAPNATTVLQFRPLLEKYGQTRKLFEAINGKLSEAGLMMREGTIAAPPAAKNEAKTRDPEMHQTKRGNQWYFGITSRRRRTPAGRSREAGCGHERSEAAQVAHVGVDAESGLVQTVVGTAANEADITQTGHLPHGQKKDVLLDAGYTGAKKRGQLRDFGVNWGGAMKRGKLKAVPADSLVDQLLRQLESLKASIRAKVEHPFHVVKNLFHYRKVRYQGLAKNTAHPHTLFGLANLALEGGVAS